VNLDDLLGGLPSRLPWMPSPPFWQTGVCSSPAQPGRSPGTRPSADAFQCAEIIAVDVSESGLLSSRRW